LAVSAHAAEAPDPLRVAGVEAMAGVGAAALTVPSTLALGSYIGSHTSSVTAALVPSLLLLAIVPPAAVTAAEWAAGRYVARSRPRPHPALWAAFGVNLVAIVVGSLAGVSTRDPVGFELFSLVDSLAMPLATTLVLHATDRARRPPQSRVQAAAPVAAPLGLTPAAPVVPVFRGAF
jgi:hypothetical protein